MSKKLIVVIHHNHKPLHMGEFCIRLAIRTTLPYEVKVRAFYLCSSFPRTCFDSADSVDALFMNYSFDMKSVSCFCIGILLLYLENGRFTFHIWHTGTLSTMQNPIPQIS
jgi:hypothetical protein